MGQEMVKLGGEMKGFDEVVTVVGNGTAGQAELVGGAEIAGEFDAVGEEKGWEKGRKMIDSESDGILQVAVYCV